MDSKVVDSVEKNTVVIPNPYVKLHCFKNCPLPFSDEP